MSTAQGPAAVGIQDDGGREGRGVVKGRGRRDIW